MKTQLEALWTENAELWTDNAALKWQVNSVPTHKWDTGRVSELRDLPISVMDEIECEVITAHYSSNGSDDERKDVEAMWEY